MKFTLSWLKEHLATDASIDAIVETMTMTGLEVESVENAGEKLKAFTVARIISAAKHPNADKLQVCQVETALGNLEIVCGAPNARAGLVTAFAPIGTYIPGSGITLEARPVRGVVSNGMLCSGAELELDTDADGIFELDSELKVGTPLAEALGLNDPVIDIEVTPNRPDWLGVSGIARDLAAAGVGKQTTKPIMPVPGRYPCPQKVETDDTTACPMFASRYIRGVKNGPSPVWLQRKLRAIGQKPISALVDITNLITHDRSRPLHVYDAAKLNGVVRARMGREGESFQALNKNVYNVTPAMCVIADDERVLGLGGIIGGEYSGVSETTTDILVECAYFDPTLTHQTGRALTLTTDAQYRFARGVDSAFVVPGLELATRMILDLCGGEPSEIQVAGDLPAPPKPIFFDPDRVRQLAGIDVKPTRVRAVLKDLGFETSAEGQGSKRIIVEPPTWRRDVEGPADLVEEVARIEGYDKMPMLDPPRAPGFRPPPASIGESRTRLARRAAASLGYNEAITWSFCSRAQAQAFGGGGEDMLVANPIASDLDCMRPSALPQLLAAAQQNANRGFDDARLFEAGPAYANTDDIGQKRTLTAIWRARPPRHWRAAPQPDIFDIKRDVLFILEALGAPVASLQTATDAPAHWRPGRTGTLKLGPKVVAYYGEIHPRALKAINVEAPALAFEIFLDALPAPRAPKNGQGRTKPPLEKLDLQPLTRDFAFIVDDGVSAQDVVRAALGADKALITDVNLFDVYRGERMPAGKKSLAIEVTLQPREKTLTDSEIEAASAKIVSAVMKATGGTLRG
ncbi:phenylalanine--tRNA ligase subunit beta [Terricaulis silvestris]|uniref:Phenylalanine--tRNA ligase beta subunit n=1 Tax=Terricaulis silvestris TaxID=2686094 RepID=A0A6I6MGT3_9CAUL|nr:phenylalanine--tRNA ligase subunit beta [Terricaulis silvestris]QGZ93955.1 Phenylalanine--tRNA ligase beta subunit [Terricaulis silvestris]